MSPKLGLKNLYLDALANILSYLSPGDILRVTRVCKSLHEAAELRSLWLELARSILEEHGVMHSNALLDGLDTRVLQHLAFSPERFTRLIKSSSGEIKPSSVKVLLGHQEAMASAGLTSSCDIHCPLLLPGGRFLFLMLKGTGKGNNTRKACFQLWDLGIPGSEQRFQLVSKYFVEDSYNSWEVVPDTTTPTYYIAAQARLGETLDAYVFDPRVPVRFAIPFNQLVTESSIEDSGTFEYKMATLCEDHTIVVWDYRRRLAACWDIPPDLVSGDQCALHLFENGVFLIQGVDVFQWPIPELHDQDYLQTSGLVRPTTVLAPAHYASEEITFTALQRSIPHKAPQSHLALISRRKLDSAGIRFLRLGTAQDTIKTPHANHPKIWTEFPLQHSPSNREGFTQMRVCNQGFLFSYDESKYGDPVGVYVSPQEWGFLDIHEVWLGLGYTAPTVYHSMCSLTGRLIFVNVADDTFVVDYLRGS